MQTLCILVINRFPLFIGAYFVLQVVVRLFVTDVAVLDESEQLVLSQYFAWGYNQQPPLYTWLQILVFNVLGISILGLSVLKNSFLFLLYFYVYKTGLLLSENRVKAALSALSLLLLPQFVWDAQVDQVHTVMLTSATAMTVYYFFKIAIKTPSTKDFILLGVTVALGLLAKYNFVLVIAGLLGTALMIPSFRAKFLEKRVLVTAGITVIAVLPHFVWFLSHLEFATSLTAERMGVTGESGVNKAFSGLGKLLVASLAFISPFWLFFAGFFGNSFRWRNKIESRAILCYMAMVYALLVVIVLLAGATSIKERWLQPYLYLFPLLLFLHTTVETINARVKAYVVTCAAIAAVVILIMIARPMLIDVREKPSRGNYPFTVMAQELRGLVDDDKNTLFHGEDMFIAGNIRLFFPDSTVITPYVPLQPYEISPRMIFVYHKMRPELLNKVTERGFLCEEYSRQLTFKYSDKQYFSVSYAVCNLP